MNPETCRDRRDWSLYAQGPMTMLDWNAEVDVFRMCFRWVSLPISLDESFSVFIRFAPDSVFLYSFRFLFISAPDEHSSKSFSYLLSMTVYVRIFREFSESASDQRSFESVTYLVSNLPREDVSISSSWKSIWERDTENRVRADRNLVKSVILIFPRGLM